MSRMVGPFKNDLKMMQCHLYIFISGEFTKEKQHRAPVLKRKQTLPVKDASEKLSG